MGDPAAAHAALHDALDRLTGDAAVFQAAGPYLTADAAARVLGISTGELARERDAGTVLGAPTSDGG